MVWISGAREEVRARRCGGGSKGAGAGAEIGAVVEMSKRSGCLDSGFVRG